MPNIQIKQLHLRLRGLSAATARRDAAGLGSALAEQWSQRPGSLSVPPTTHMQLGHAAVSRGKAWPAVVARKIIAALSSPQRHKT